MPSRGLTMQWLGSFLYSHTPMMTLCVRFLHSWRPFCTQGTVMCRRAWSTCWRPGRRGCLLQCGPSFSMLRLHTRKGKMVVLLVEIYMYTISYMKNVCGGNHKRMNEREKWVESSAGVDRAHNILSLTEIKDSWYRIPSLSSTKFLYTYVACSKSW